MSFSSCYSIKFLDDDHNINNLEEEFGNDFHFKAYPSNYFNTILDHEKNNNMKKNLEIISRFQRFKNLEKLDEEQNQAKVITISVDRFGAKGDGKIDDTNIYGTLLASDDTSNYNKDSRHWLIFDSVQKLVVGGAGVINGNGKIWWKNSCKINKKLALTFYKCNNLKVKDLKIEDAQQIHLLIEKCVVVEVSKLVVSSPENSPNTDGIHITNTQNIQISDSTIATGDDCISIVDGSQKVLATSITCGPGHGISIGSLGGGNSEAHVSDIHVNGAKLSGTTNGLRIKTWPGGFGSASNIKFQNVVMNNVKNPIIIDQNYCDQADGPCKAE
ncbi:hypothetical protein MTR67_017206, partial [Solanum verrucosum]